MNTTRHTSCVRHRRGVVLLIALGMLAFFSLLTVTYIIFSSQAKTASASVEKRINEGDRPQDVFPQIMEQIVVGTSNPRSAAFQISLLEDLYGWDSVRLRVANYRTESGSVSPSPPPAPPAEAFGELFGTLPGTYQDGDAPPSTLFRFPLRFARWNFDGSVSTGSQSARQVPEFSNGFQGPALGGDNPTTGTTEPNDVNANEQFDDAYTGRIVSFLEGPLAGRSFQILRSFGLDNLPAYTAGNPESILSHNLVIDLSQLPSQTIEIGGETFDRWRVADRSPTALLYGPGPDGLPGIGGFDDDSDMTVDELDEYGSPGSDDIGNLLVINGQIFNGDGMDAGFAAGTSTAVGPSWNAFVNNNPASNPPNSWTDPGMTDLLQPNRRFLGPTAGGQPDEAFDAPGLENTFLAWQPSVRGSGVPIHGNVEADGLINQAIVPSFHRPALFNYLMNQPIDFPGSMTPARTFVELDPAGVPEDEIRLHMLSRRLRRACLRPLPFIGNAEDLDGDNEFMDGTPNFTGSNPTPILRVQLNPDPTTPTDKAQLRLLARWLVNGPWDVDNDRDGIPDSLWMDFALPTTTARDGTILRPLVAALIEDLDGRVNLNTAGNYAQLAHNYFGLDFTTPPPTTTASTIRFTARGFGIGPSEVFPGFLLGRQVNSPPTGVGLPALNTVFGRVLQSRYGGRGTQLGAPGYDDGLPAADDAISQMIHPARRDTHASNAPMGKPLDMFGRGSVDTDIQGNVVISPNLVSALGASPNRNERTNEPYEMATDETALGNDEPFSVEEFLAVIDRSNPSRASFRTRLLELLDQTLQNNPELDRLITTESRSQRSPEMSGYGGAGGTLGSVTDLYVTRLEQFMGPLTNSANVATIENSLTRMLAVEFRKGTKLNLNRSIGNGIDDNGNGFVDDGGELLAEPAYPNLAPHPGSTVTAQYVPYDPAAVTDFANLTGQELLARHLYVLMFMLVRDPTADSSTAPPGLLVPNFPYPTYTRADGTAVNFVNDNAIRNQYVARRLAQWAVNAVDFRDSNCAMTRLRFDLDPFDSNGWNTTGGFSTVWGAEPSDLMLTEGIATHDKRTRDTALELNPGAQQPTRTITNPTQTPDADMDQLRIPQASAFIEVKNIRPLNNGSAYLHYPPELYDFSGPTPSLDLGRVVNGQSPVWRIAVSRAVGAADPNPEWSSPRWLSDAERLSSSAIDPFMGVPIVDFQQEDIHLATFQLGADGLLPFGPRQRQLAIDRVVWFTDLDPSAVVLPADAPLVEQVFRNVGASAVTPLLAPGQFAMVAPRNVTTFGQNTTCAEGNAFANDPSQQMIDVQAAEVHYTDLAGTDQTPIYQGNANYRIRNTIPIIAQAQRPPTAAWANYVSTFPPNEQVDFGFSISAPLTDNANYYAAPTKKLNAAAMTGYPFYDSYYDTADPVDATNGPLDQPLDELATAPLTANGWIGGGTHQDASTAFLQRLADPTQPWDALDNPYITVDWITMDLHVFSGHQDLSDLVDADGDGAVDEPVDPPTPVGSFAATMDFDTRRKIPDIRRDRAATITGTTHVHRSLFMTRLNILQGDGVQGANAYFDYDLRNNINLPALTTGLGDNPDSQPFPTTLGFISREFGLPRLGSGLIPDYAGMPEDHYMANIPWYDRDYASPFELTMVPACSAARFSVEFDLGTNADFTVIDLTENENATPFRHLLGFDFGYDAPAQPMEVLGIGPGFEQIFDFIDTGPIYADDERWLDPQQTRLSGNATLNRVTETLRPPFNHITMNRVPGKVNVNTMPDFLQINDINDRTDFDRGEVPAQPENASNTSRYALAGANTYTGNGDVYQSIAWGFSTGFELDSGEFGLAGGTTIPSAGQANVYASTQDTPFGYNFKGFIESRTGFSQNAPSAGYVAPLEDLRNRYVFHTYPSRFAGLFGPTSTARLPLLQTYLPKDVGTGPAAVRRAHDVTLMRPHPDLERRSLTTPPAVTDFDLNLDTVAGSQLQSQLLSTPLFERTHAELHRDGRYYDRNPIFRMRNTAKLANTTTYHSNVFLVRLTIGYFVVDPQTGEVGAEYGIETNEVDRQSAVFVVDRTIPVAFERGQTHNAMNTVLLQSLDQ